MTENTQKRRNVLQRWNDKSRGEQSKISRFGKVRRRTGKPADRKRKLADRKRRLMVFGCLVILLLLAAVFARYLCPYDPYEQNYGAALLPPCPAHPLGTDRFGRDMLSRVLMGAQTSIFSSLILTGFVAVVGTAAGLLAGYAGGAFDVVIMRISDVCLAFPGIVFALAVAAVLHGGMPAVVLALAVVHWPKYARIARSQTLSVKQEDYIAAARLAGCRTGTILFRHIFPNILSPVLVTAMLDIGTMMMEIAALSFLGLGAQPPMAEWGSMMSGGRSLLQLYPWVVLAPGAAIFITVVIFNLFGEAFRDYRNMQDV